MKERIALGPLLVALILFLAGNVSAQSLTVIHSFSPLLGADETNSDGAFSNGGLILSGNTLYGVSTDGGKNGFGTIFALNMDGTGFTNLHNFTAQVGGTNSDGGGPYDGLILSSNVLYGAANIGGKDSGTIFKINTDGSGYTNLHMFAFAQSTTSTNSDGATPRSQLIVSGNFLYGTAEGGGTGAGTIFRMNTDGTGFTNLYFFSALSGALATNQEGSHPRRMLLLGDTLYGMATFGGPFGYGSLFAINTNGMGFTNLHIFTGGSDGGCPNAGLTLLNNQLFGTAVVGGTSNGTVFAINTNGSGFTVLHTFTKSSGAGDPLNITNQDGVGPTPGLTVSGNMLLGVTFTGGVAGHGTIFAMNPDGSGFSTLHAFADGNAGGYPFAPLIISGNAVYGTAKDGGIGTNGVVFSLSFAPSLALAATGGNVILTWPTNVAGFDYTGYTLQSTVNLSAPAWTNVSNAPTPVNGQNTVTNAITGAQMFYRLKQ